MAKLQITVIIIMVPILCGERRTILSNYCLQFRACNAWLELVDV